jgi:hypothetical protein
MSGGFAPPDGRLRRKRRQPSITEFAGRKFRPLQQHATGHGSCELFSFREHIAAGWSSKTHSNPN